MSAPMVPAPMTCARSGLKLPFGASVLHLLGEAEDAAEVLRGFRDHQRREGLRLLALHAIGRAAVLLEQIDEAEGRRIMILAHLLARLLPHLAGEIAADRRIGHGALHEAGRPGLAALQHGLARRPSQVMPRGHQLIDKAHAARDRRAQHRARQHRLHGGDGTGELDGPRRAVEAREDAELDLGKADAGGVVARRDPVLAGHGELEPAAEAIAVDRGNRRDRQRLDAIEQRRHARDGLGHGLLGFEILELADVGADDEAIGLAGDEDEAAESSWRRPPPRRATTISPSSSSTRRESEFWLSPARSRIAQPMPSKSTSKRQSVRAGRAVVAVVSVMQNLWCAQGARRTPLVGWVEERDPTATCAKSCWVCPRTKSGVDPTYKLRARACALSRPRYRPPPAAVSRVVFEIVR